MVIESLKLEAINRTMLSSNSYSQQDARQVSAFLYGNTAIALSVICEVALRYADTQAFIKNIQADLEESLKYYRGKGSRQYLENNVSGEVHLKGDVVESITIVCNPEHLKNLPFVDALRRTEFLITIKPQDIAVVMGHLRDCGLKLTDFKAYLKAKGIKDSQLKTGKKDVEFEDGKVKLDKVSPRKVAVICNPELQAIVREIPGFAVGKSKHIEVPVTEMMNLYTRLSTYSRKSGTDLDLSDFKDYIDLTVHEGSFTASAFKQGVNIFLKIEYHPVIHETLLNITTMRYIERVPAWTFHKRHLGTVIERLLETNLSIDMESLYAIQEDLDLEYELTAVELFDLSMVKSFEQRPPWAHQVAGAKRILDQRRIILADEMGAGKTLTCILSALSIGITLSGPLVIVCPSALKLNWVKEIRQIDKSSPICVVEGNEIYKANWIIVNYDILDRHSETLMSYQPKFIAYDESHKIKSVNPQGVPGSKRAAHSIMISQFSPYVVSLTGTPMPKGPIDLFNQFKLIDHPLSDDFINFGITYCDGKISKNGWNFEGSSNEEELHDILTQCMIRNRKEDCLDLPAKLQTFMPVDVDLTKYRAAVEEYMEAREISGRAYAMVIVGQMKKYLAYSKIKSTLDMIEQVVENGDSCVVFSDYTAVIETLTVSLNNKYKGMFARKITCDDGTVREVPIEEVAITITGKDNSTRKFEKCEAFQEGLAKVIICNMKAGGVGLNMTRANKLIFNDLTWLPDDHFQAEDRIHRGGQTQKVEVVYLIANGAEIDEKLSNVIETRAKMSATIIDGGESKGRQVSIMKGVLKYLEEVQSNKRKPGDFLVDELDLFEDDLELEGDIFNDDNGDFAPIEFDESLESGEMDTTRTISQEPLPEPVEVKHYPVVEDGVYVNPPHTLSILSQEPLIYQYTKDFEEQGYALALQMRFLNNQLAFMVLKRSNYTGEVTNMNYTRASQVCGSFMQCDEVGTHIQQHLTKIDGYLTKGNLQYAKATVASLLNTLKKYLK